MTLRTFSLRTHSKIIETIEEFARRYNVSRSFIADLALRFALEHKKNEFEQYLKQFIPVALDLGINPKRLKQQKPYKKTY